jgi:hypothetical protein
MGMRRALAGMVAFALLAVVAGCSSDPARAQTDPARSTLDRPADPVVVTGAQVPALAGARPERIVAFRAVSQGSKKSKESKGWKQVPVQVDERVATTVRAAYDLPATQFGASTDIPVTVYADPHTFVGADPDPTVDANDEIAFMAHDAGGKAGHRAAPPGTMGGGVELKIRDPGQKAATGYVYLFRSDGSLDPGAGQHYVDYDFKLRSGDYNSTYKRAAGPNPEDSTVTGRTYTAHFADRWLLDGLTLTAGDKPDTSLIERLRYMFPISCARSEDTFDSGEGAFIVNKVGPVRALRSYVGANSGPNTEATQAFYDHAIDTTVDLRVHVIPGIASHLDLSRAAMGMTFRNPQVPDGVPIDVTRDEVPAGAPTWSTITGPQGGLAFSTTFDISQSELAPQAYYQDSKTPSLLQCTGDQEAIGESGTVIDQTIACTDPGTGCADHLRSRTRLVTTAGKPHARDVERLAQQGLTPLKVTEAPFPGP